MRYERRARLREAALWVMLFGLALAWGVLVAPGTGRELPPEPARLECNRWTETPQIWAASGRELDVLRVCAGYDRVVRP